MAKAPKPCAFSSPRIVRLLPEAGAPLARMSTDSPRVAACFTRAESAGQMCAVESEGSAARLNVKCFLSCVFGRCTRIRPGAALVTVIAGDGLAVAPAAEMTLTATKGALASTVPISSALGQKCSTRRCCAALQRLRYGIRCGASRA
eukprot:4104560-Pleurochrysis_carterae.AAC.2